MNDSEIREWIKTLQRVIREAKKSLDHDNYGYQDPYDLTKIAEAVTEHKKTKWMLNRAVEYCCQGGKLQKYQMMDILREDYFNFLMEEKKKYGKK